MLNAKLVVVGGEVKTTEVKLRLPCVIGRGKGSNVVLPHPLVSRQHCELFEISGRLWVRDLGSLNGTYVNNEKVTESELPPNELLTVGTVTFRAMYEPVVDLDAPIRPEPNLRQDAEEHDNQSTIRVAGVSSPAAANDEEVLPEAEADDLDDAAGMPSTPLFDAPAETPRTVPMPHSPRTASSQAGKTASVPAGPSTDDEENIDADDDLNDFLKGLGKK